MSLLRWNDWIDHNVPATEADRVALPVPWIMTPSYVTTFMLLKMEQGPVMKGWCHATGCWFMHTHEWDASGNGSRVHILRFATQSHMGIFGYRWR